MKTDCEMYLALKMLCDDAQLGLIPGVYLARRVLAVAESDEPMARARQILGAGDDLP